MSPPKVTATPLPALPEVRLVESRRFGDERGWFSETFNAADFAAAGIDAAFVQDNQSFSAAAGTVRGLHFQRPPHAQDKLVRVLRGAILDVVVDIRAGSPSFGHHVSVRLDAEKGQQLWVPAGFAHGFCTLEPDTEVFYKVTAFYSPADEGGVLWNDPDLGIAWPVSEADATLAPRDRDWPRLRDLEPLPLGGMA